MCFKAVKCCSRNLCALLRLPMCGQKQILAFPTFSLVSIVEHMFQPLLQAVIDVDRLLQTLAQVLDLDKILFQQVSPCCIKTGKKA